MLREPRSMDFELMVLEAVVEAVAGRHEKGHRGRECSDKKGNLESGTSLSEGLGLEEA